MDTTAPEKGSTEAPTMELPATGQVWRHYHGREYKVLGLAHYEGTGGAAVIYRQVDSREVWIRALSDFLGYSSEGKKRRFVRIS